MIIDNINNLFKYSKINEKINKLIEFINQNDLNSFGNGHHEINGESLFVIVKEYQTEELEKKKMGSS